MENEFVQDRPDDLNDLRAFHLDGEEIERRRQALGWSMENFAHAAKRHTKTLKRAIRGEPTFLSTARAIADALDVSCATLLLPRDREKTRRDDAYDFSILTVGVIESEEQLAVIGNLVNEIKTRLSAANIRIEVHAQNLHLVQGKGRAPYAIVRVEAPRPDRKLCRYPSSFSSYNLAYIIVPLEEHEGLVLEDKFDELCNNLFLKKGDFPEIALLSGPLHKDRRECELIESVFSQWCAERR